MSIVVAVSGWDPDTWAERLQTELPTRKIQTWHEDRKFSAEERADIRYLLAWKPPRGLCAKFPNLSVLFSLGAGVDHILQDSDLPSCPLVRVVDPDLTARMGEWIVLQTLSHLRRASQYAAQQRDLLWQPIPQPAASAVTVGVLGIGVLGLHAANLLKAIGFPVIGWGRSRKTLDGIKTFAGHSELNAFLCETDILVSLLPHTPETEGILSIDLFRQLRGHDALGGPVLINAGRGKTQIDHDIVQALKDGVLSGASLDVFENEPLPMDSELWTQPKVIVTPHVAADSDPAKLASYIAAQIRGFEERGTLHNIVDRERGY
ncbi:MAG: glyoxylate/hydroxypyruvate reductase A [Stappiaceae bacterium]